MFGKQKTDKTTTETLDDDHPLEAYHVNYRGGLPQLPKAKAGKIVFEIHPSYFRLKPASGSKGFWALLDIPFAAISEFEIVERNVSSFEAIAGGLNSRQLNQKNNIHISYAGSEGQTLLRLEMISGVTVMGQAKKCAELADRLRNLRIREQFETSSLVIKENRSSLADELDKLASLKANGVLSEEEFIAAKARLLET